MYTRARCWATSYCNNYMDGRQVLSKDLDETQTTV